VPLVTVAVNVTDWPTATAAADVDKAVVVAARGLTVSVSAAEVLGLKVASPEYEAVIECVPTVRAEVVSVALPALTVTGAPRAVVPSRNVTVPVKVPAVVLETVAVNVTEWPTTIAAADVARVVVLLTTGLLTV
jgi:hypothetical protein